jgi:hypothetical protein
VPESTRPVLPPESIVVPVSGGGLALSLAVTVLASAGALSFSDELESSVCIDESAGPVESSVVGESWTVLESALESRAARLSPAASAGGDVESGVVPASRDPSAPDFASWPPSGSKPPDEPLEHAAANKATVSVATLPVVVPRGILRRARP